MSVSRSNEVFGNCERIVPQLAEADGRHQQALKAHDRMRRELSEYIDTNDRAQLLAAWQRYRNVVAELDAVTSEIESLRLSAG